MTDLYRLDIGCGTFKRDGYTGVDPYVETDIQANMWDIPAAGQLGERNLLIA